MHECLMSGTAAHADFTLGFGSPLKQVYPSQRVLTRQKGPPSISNRHTTLGAIIKDRGISGRVTDELLNGLGPETHLGVGGGSQRVTVRCKGDGNKVIAQ